MRPISENERRSLSQRQVRLLESAFLATRPGGQVVYATCTLAPEEDEAVVDHLLRKFPGNAQVADVSTHLPAPASGLTMDGERKFSPELKKSLRLWPHRFGTSGFFSALIIKNDKVYGKQHQLQPINFPAGNENFQSLSPRQKAELVDRLNQDYGFNLSGLINEQNLALIRQPTALGHINTFLVSNLWFDRFNGFRYTNLGLLLGREINGFFELSHEFSARFGAGFTNGSCLIPDDMVDRWCTGHDLEGSWMSEKLKNPIVIVTDNSGRILGRGRIQANRLKNLIPKRLI